MSHTVFPFSLCLSGLILGLSLTGAARAATHAVLVGVSDYQVLEADLRGPANDVGLVAETLLARGVAADHIRLLAAPDARAPQGVTVHAAPTRAAILSELGRMAQLAGPGDTVFFYYSGHGAQAPDLNGDEAGGYDEILLPTDASGWKGAIGRVENAIVDDELAPLMQAILDRGAQVVAVLDACHSATGFRALGRGVARYVSPAQLGLPDTPGTPGITPAEGAATHLAEPLHGDFVFLYSSQSDQRSFEYPLGDASDPANWYGDFTRALMGVLAQESSLSWAQALQAASDRMARSGPAAQTPDGEGTLMQAAVFGQARPARRYGFAAGTLAAGLLAGLNEGAEVAVFDSLLAEAPVARATLHHLTPDSAAMQSADMLPPKGYAALLRPGLPAPVRLAVPVRADAADGHDYAAILTGLAAMDAPEGVTLNAPDYDMLPYLVDGTLALTARDGVLDADGPGTSPRLVQGEDLAAFLDRAARVTRLRAALALAEGGGGLAFAMPGAGLKQDLAWLRGTSEGDACADPQTDPTPITAPITAGHCDQIWLTLSNGSSTARDVTVLYVDRAFHITPIWPAPGLSNRIAFGEAQEVGMLIQNPSQRRGAEEIIVLSVPARDGAPRTVLTALADPETARDLTSGDALSGWLGAALTPDESSRNFSFSGAIPALEITRHRISLHGGT
ncbi:caspase family protein [Thalassovita taeanensis]|nr:caspase family protein [Thalassovita taeanensis]